MFWIFGCTQVSTATYQLIVKTEWKVKVVDIRAESVILGFEYIDTMQEQVIAIDWGSTKLVSEWVFGPIGDLAVWMETATCCLSHIFLDKTKIHIHITDMLKSFISQSLANYISLKGGGDDNDYSPLQSKACLTFEFILTFMRVLSIRTDPYQALMTKTKKPNKENCKK